MPIPVHLKAVLPLNPAMTDEEMARLIYGIIAVIGIKPSAQQDTDACMLDYDIAVDTSGMPTRSDPCFRLIGRDLHVCGSMAGAGECRRWTDGHAEYVSGSPLMAELMTILSAVVEARPGAILGSMRIEGFGDHAGPVLITEQGVRWCPSETLTGETLHGATMRTVHGSIPPSMLVPSIDRDPRCHIDVDRRALRLHLECDAMKRAVSASRVAVPDQGAEAA